jgi:hypothetical protein
MVIDEVFAREGPVCGIVEDSQILIDRSAGGVRWKSLVALDPILPIGIGLSRLTCSRSTNLSIDLSRWSAGI